MYIQAIKFGLVGLLNTATDFAVFSACIYFLGFGVVPANVFAFVVAVSQSYFVNKIWTFKAAASQKKNASQMTKFVTIQLTALGISSALLLLTENHLHWSLGKIVAVLFTFCWSFLLIRYFVFSEEK